MMTTVKRCSLSHSIAVFRGHGPLKTTMDVIRAAQEISVDGSKVSFGVYFVYALFNVCCILIAYSVQRFFMFHFF